MSELSRFVYIRSHVILHVKSGAQMVNSTFILVQLAWGHCAIRGTCIELQQKQTGKCQFFFILLIIFFFILAISLNNLLKSFGKFFQIWPILQKYHRFSTSIGSQSSIVFTCSLILMSTVISQSNYQRVKWGFPCQ